MENNIINNSKSNQGNIFTNNNNNSSSPENKNILTENTNYVETEIDIDDDEFVPESVFKYSNTESFICIELENNNKIYLKYEQSWSIKDVIHKLYLKK